jgi:predicted DNA-binding WGR domain protein
MTAVILYRVDASRNMRRFYRLDIQRELFGFWQLMREWGRIGRPGQTRVQSYATFDEAYAAFHRQRRTREKRGYDRFPVFPGESRKPR